MSSLVLAMACLVPSAGRAACDVDRFGEGATGTCARSQPGCVGDYLPADIAAIGKGAVVETVGLGPNDGRATWRALDIDHREVVVVERYAGRHAAQAPRLAASSARETVKPAGADPSSGVDHVRRYPLSAARFTELACLASRAWGEGAPPTHEVTDTGSRFYLLRPQAARVAAANGTFKGTPGELARKVDQVVRQHGTTPH